MEKDKSNRYSTIIGRVVTVEWDGENINSIEILTDEDSYTVDLDYVGRQLIDFVGEVVKVVGFINIYADGTNRILLDDFEVLDDDGIFDENNYVPDVENELDSSDDYTIEEDY